MRVTEVGHAVNNTRLSSEQRRGQDRQRGIFRAANLDRTGKRITAVDEDLIHTWQKGTVSRRYNRSSNKCRGNFFPPGPKEGSRFGRVLFPAPAFQQAGAAMALDQSTRVPAHHPAYRRTMKLLDRAILRAKECAGPASICKEDSRRQDRKFLRHSPRDDFSETGRDHSGLVWLHSLARARAHHLKHQRRESAPQEIPQRD